jgi:hypothetical protein
LSSSHTLFSIFADYELHFLAFNHTKTATGGQSKHVDHDGVVLEPFLAQLADVSVAVEADFFVGHLASSSTEGGSGNGSGEGSGTAELVNMLQRSRGDGGSDFHSLDAGSSWQGF